MRGESFAAPVGVGPAGRRAAALEHGPRRPPRRRPARISSSPRSTAVPIESRPLPTGRRQRQRRRRDAAAARRSVARRPAARRHARVRDRRATSTAGSAASSRSARSTSRTRRAAARCRATRCSRSRSAPTGSLEQVVVRRSSGHRELDAAAIAHRAARLALRPVPAGDARALPAAALRLRVAVPRGPARRRLAVGARQRAVTRPPRRL